MIATPTACRIGAATAMLLGAASVVAGSQVLLGVSTPDYTVIRPLVVYNVLAGAVSIVAGFALWARAKWASRLAVGITSGHLMVLLLLAAASARGVSVAAESFAAMTFRSVVWMGIAAISARLPDFR